MSGEDKALKQSRYIASAFGSLSCEAAEIVGSPNTWFPATHRKVTPFSLKLTLEFREESLQLPFNEATLAFDSLFKETIYPGEVTHSDFCGNAPKIINGNRSSATFADHCSPYPNVAETKLKGDGGKLFNTYKSLTQT